MFMPCGQEPDWALCSSSWVHTLDLYSTHMSTLKNLYLRCIERDLLSWNVLHIIWYWKGLIILNQNLAKICNADVQLLLWVECLLCFDFWKLLITKYVKINYSLQMVLITLDSFIASTLPSIKGQRQQLQKWELFHWFSIHCSAVTQRSSGL